VLGRTGRNFAAGMSGGVAYVYDPDRTFAVSCNKEMVGLTEVGEPEEVGALKALIERHVAVTGSELGRRLLGDWKATLSRFVKVLPHDYRRMVESQRQLRAKGMSPAEAELAAFELNAHDQARVGGN
jgi:glutamate synthase (NADPH/NADH) large chain